MTSPTNPFSDPFRHEPVREDILVGRVVDGEAFANDWEELERIARADPAVWERLGRAQRAHARLEREVEDAIAVAELIDLPRNAGATVYATARWREYSGWALAAVLCLAFLGRTWVSPTGPISNGFTSGIGSIVQPKTQPLTPEQALAQYLQVGQAAGQVVGEMPAMLVDARDLGDGQGQEVWYVRPVLERRKVTDISVMSVLTDEHGQPQYVRREVPAEALPRAQTKQPAPPLWKNSL